MLHYLISTRSFADAICALTQIRYLPPLAIVSSLLWVLSPLGSQSSLRIIYTKDKRVNATTNVRYLDTGPLRSSFIEWSLNNEQSITHQHAAIDAYDATLLSIMQQPGFVLESPTDSWGNAKVPWIENLNASMNTGNWLDTTQLGGVDSYSSLTGIQVHDLPLYGTITLPIETSYISLNCTPLLQKRSFSGRPGSLHARISCPSCPSWTANYFQRCAEDPLNIWCIRLAAYLGLSNPQNNPSEDIGPFSARTISLDIWESHIYDTPRNPLEELRHGQGNAWSAKCAVFEKRVEVLVECESEKCHSTAIRYSQIDNRPANITALDYWVSHIFPNGLEPQIYAGLAPQFVSQPFTRHTEPTHVTNLFSNITEKTLSARLGAVLNTYIQNYLSCNIVEPFNVTRYLISQNLGEEEFWGPRYTSADGLSAVTVSADFGTAWANLQAHFNGYAGLFRYTAATNATITHKTEVYQADPLWITLLLLCSLTTMTIGIINIVRESRLLIPDRFDPVIGLTYNNPDLGIPWGCSTVGVEDRLRLLSKLEVQVGDLAGNEEIGKIGFALKNKVCLVRKEKLYD